MFSNGKDSGKMFFLPTGLLTSPRASSICGQADPGVDVLDLTVAGGDLLRGGNSCLSWVLAKEQNELKCVGNRILCVTFSCLYKVLGGGRVSISAPC